MLIVGIFTSQSKIKVMNKTQLIEMLEGPASAEFTFMPVSKVVELIKQLEEAPSTSLDSKSLVDFLENFKVDVLKRVEVSINGYDHSSAADKDSAEFSMGYRNQVELDSIDVDLSGLEDEIVTDIEVLFDETISELEKEYSVVEVEA